MKIKTLINKRLSLKGEKFSRNEKLLNYKKSCEFVRVAHSLGKTVVLDEGTWDLTHAGHVQHIREAAKYGDLVLLRLASAKYARKVKGVGRPIEIYRGIVVSEFEGVDAVWVDETAISPNNIKKNAKILAAIDADFLTLETTDEKLELKVKSAEYANKQLGSRIKPVVFKLKHLNSTTLIIQKIAKFIK